MPGAAAAACGPPAGRAVLAAAAAMREALNQLRDWALLDINENVIRSDEPNYRKLVDGIVEIANAALAAPARNCDICRTKREAKMEYDSRHDAEYGSKDDFVDWLFRPAEGGAE